MSYSRAIDQQVAKNFGENSSLQYDWSSHIDEILVQFFFQLVRSDDHTDLENKLRAILSHIKGKEILFRQYLTMAYKLIGHTRDIIHGKGEQQLTFMQILIWHEFYPYLAKQAFTVCVENKEYMHPYGSWKDIKYFCHYIYQKLSTKQHPLIEHAIQLARAKLEHDWLILQTVWPPPRGALSLIAKWLPREKSKKFGWIHTRLAKMIFSHFLTTANSKKSAKKARLKCKIHLTKWLTKLNKYLNTVQIKQCNGQWNSINYNHITAQTTRRQKLAFLNKTSMNLQRSCQLDRIEAGEKYRLHIAAATRHPEIHFIRGRRCMPYELVKDAIQALRNNIQEEKDIVNLQWRDNQHINHSLKDLIVCCDTSSIMSHPTPISLYNAIGLGIRCAELSEGPFQNRLFTFDANPRWINLEDCETFVDKVDKLCKTTSGRNTNFYKMVQMILTVYINNNTPPHHVENKILVVFSNHQMDPRWTQSGDSCMDVMYDSIARMYASAGRRTKWKRPYKPPHCLFWNLRLGKGFPVYSKQKNVTVMSGYNSALLNILCMKRTSVLTQVSPYHKLANILDHKRYQTMQTIIDGCFRKEHLKNVT